MNIICFHCHGENGANKSSTDLLQVTLGLLGASKTYKLRYITVNTVDANPVSIN